jgi:hypothetical protein
VNLTLISTTNPDTPPLVLRVVFMDEDHLVASGTATAYGSSYDAFSVRFAGALAIGEVTLNTEVIQPGDSVEVSCTVSTVKHP